MDNLPQIFNKMLPSGEIIKEDLDIDHQHHQLINIENDKNNQLIPTFDDRLKTQQLILPNSRVCGRIKLDNRKSAKHHINIVKQIFFFSHNIFDYNLIA